MKTPRTLSPYLLIQEFLRDDPWKLMVAVIMLNQTSAKQVWPILPEFFDRWPDANAFLHAPTDEVKQLIRSLGFKNVRYDRLLGMTLDFLVGVRPPQKVFGLGKYGIDSYQMFCEGVLVPDVQDKELKNYLHWAMAETDP